MDDYLYRRLLDDYNWLESRTYKLRKEINRKDEIIDLLKFKLELLGELPLHFDDNKVHKDQMQMELK